MNLTERFSDAVVAALRLHRDQKRKTSASPYVSHLLRVTGIVLEHGADEDTAIAAILHDAVEDQGGAPTRERIRREFGERVASIVQECSDTDQTPKPPWRERKEIYLAHLATASPSARLIAAADKLDNTRSLLGDYRRMGDKVWEYFRGGCEGTLWYLRSVRDILKKVDPNALVDELDRAVAELEREVRMTNDQRQMNNE